MMKSESPRSPSLMRMVFLGNDRITPDAAICRSRTSPSGASGSCGGAKRWSVTASASPVTGSIETALIVDDLAVVRQFPRRPEGDLAAQLRHFANRTDDRFGRRRCTRRFGVQRHAVGPAGGVDDEPGPPYLRMPPHDL